MPLNIIKQAEDGKKVSPHLALTHESQGFSANNRHVSLLMKAGVELDDEAKELLKAVLGDTTIPMASFDNLKDSLELAVKKFDDKADVEDFDNSYVVFSKEDGLFYAEYTFQDNQIVLGDVASPVSRFVYYEATAGELLMSDSTSNDSLGVLPEGVRSLIVKSFDSISSNEKIKAIYKSKHENEVKNVEQEIQKAVEAKQAVETQLTKALADLEKAAQERDALKAQVEEIVKAQAEAKAAQRLDLVKSVIKEEDQAVAFAKSVETLEDEAFQTVVKALQLKEQVVEQTDLFKSVSQAQVETGEQQSTLAALLKQKYTAPQA